VYGFAGSAPRHAQQKLRRKLCRVRQACQDLSGVSPMWHTRETVGPRRSANQVGIFPDPEKFCLMLSLIKFLTPFSQKLEESKKELKKEVEEYIMEFKDKFKDTTTTTTTPQS
jgi:hypothetical protein